MYHVSPLSPSWLKAFLSLVAALFLGWIIGQILSFNGQCLRHGHPCYEYSQIKTLLSYLLSWPLILMHAVRGKDTEFEQGMLPLWLYYYFLVCVVDYGERVVRKRYLE
jgi:hypothetical protein